MSIKPLSYHGFSLDFLVAGSNREKEGKRPGDNMAWPAKEKFTIHMTRPPIPGWQWRRSRRGPSWGDRKPQHGLTDDSHTDWDQLASPPGRQGETTSLSQSENTSHILMPEITQIQGLSRQNMRGVGHDRPTHWWLPWQQPVSSCMPLAGFAGQPESQSRYHRGEWFPVAQDAQWGVYGARQTAPLLFHCWVRGSHQVSLKTKTNLLLCAINLLIMYTRYNVCERNKQC